MIMSAPWRREVVRYALSLPIVMFATIFFSTVFRFANFLSFDSAASNSARNSCKCTG